jgi:anion-transporting  ArsA/GET3 family ATPase
MAPRIYLRVRDNLKLDKTPFTDIIEGWSKLSGEIVDWFRQPENVSFVLVTVPEALGVYQSRRLVDQFARFGLDIRHMIVNRVVVQADCEFHQERQAMQQPYLELLRSEYSERMELVEVPARPWEVKGIAQLGEIERILYEN